jgi:hypothetical protein
MCVCVDLLIQHVKRMRPIILSSVACLAVPCFPYFVINSTTVKKKVTGHTISALIFSATLPEIFPILRIIHRDIVIKVQKFSCEKSDCNRN